MPELKWEKFKKHNTLGFVSIDEVIVSIIGIFVFIFFQMYRVAFILFVIIWYWLKIRYYEGKIIEKEKEIYNVFFNNAKNPYGSQNLLERETEKDREPMRYDLKQLENKRKFLIDKFVVLNLILVVLIELFIKK